MRESGRLDYESLRGLLRPMRWRNNNLEIPAKAIQKGHEVHDFDLCFGTPWSV